MAEIKQTPVDWLIEELENNATMDYSFAQAHKLITLDVYTFTKLFEQAKAMEKQQIINLFKHAQVLHTMKDQMRGEQYYQETYGK